MLYIFGVVVLLCFSFFSILKLGWQVLPPVFLSSLSAGIVFWSLGSLGFVVSQVWAGNMPWPELVVLLIGCFYSISLGVGFYPPIIYFLSRFYCVGFIPLVVPSIVLCFLLLVVIKDVGWGVILYSVLLGFIAAIVFLTSARLFRFEISLKEGG